MGERAGGAVAHDLTGCDNASPVRQALSLSQNHPVIDDYRWPRLSSLMALLLLQTLAEFRCCWETSPRLLLLATALKIAVPASQPAHTDL